jgi:1,4-dihydroxy-2-naphthoyl-CoA hydrolase
VRGAKGFKTIELKSNFLGAARQGLVRGQTQAEHLGRTVVIDRVRARGSKDRAVALHADGFAVSKKNPLG